MRVPFALLAIVAICSQEACGRGIVAKKEALGAQTLARKAIGAPSFALIDARSGRVLESRNASKRMFPASTTKIMTALVVLQSGVNLEETVIVGPNADQTGESTMYLTLGERISVRHLLEAALVKSANDACVALAEHVGGTVPAFVAKMNATSRALGLRDTRFQNPHGLHDPNHYTTALDLAQIARVAMRNPTFAAIVRRKSVTMPGNALVGRTRELDNRNRLLWRYAACDGVKTGYTRQAGKCLVSSATTRVNNAPFRLLSVVLRSPDAWSDSANLLAHRGFARFTPTTVVKKGEEFGHVEVANGAFPARAVVAQDLQLPLRRDEIRALQKRVKLFPRVAPLSRGQRVGTLELRVNRETLASVSLIAREAVPASPTQVAPPRQNVPPLSLRRAEWLGIFATLLSGISLLIWRKNAQRYEPRHSQFASTRRRDASASARRSRANRSRQQR